MAVISSLFILSIISEARSKYVEPIAMLSIHTLVSTATFFTLSPPSLML